MWFFRIDMLCPHAKGKMQSLQGPRGWLRFGRKKEILNPARYFCGKGEAVGREIERKFLVVNDDFKKVTQGVKLRQGYLNSDKERTVRIRTVGDKAFLSIKGRTCGISRTEFEYEIPVADGETMLDTLAEKPLIEKVRYEVHFNGFVWEVDEFLGENSGLVVAEIELESEAQQFDIPHWLGAEVSGDARFFNSNLVRNPYSNWGRAILQGKA